MCMTPKAGNKMLSIIPNPVQPIAVFYNSVIRKRFVPFIPTPLMPIVFGDYQAGAWQRDNGLRIDHFLLSPEAVDLMTSCTIDRAPRGQEKASDHTPVLLELRTAETKNSVA